MEIKNENESGFQVIQSSASNWKIFGILLVAFIMIIASIFMGIAVYSTSDGKIVSGVFIKGVNVSGLTKEEAKARVQTTLIEKMQENLSLIHGEFETNVNLEQIRAKFDIDAAIDKAYEIGREGNVLTNTMRILRIMTANINIEPVFNLDEEELSNILQDVSTKLPDTILQSSYYIEGNQLVITKGSQGQVVDIEETTKRIRKEIINMTYLNRQIELITRTEQPNSIDIEKIHEEIYKEPIDAYYSTDPYVVHPHENGVDFNISIEEAKKILEETKDEYIVPLKLIKPNVTTNMIGNEAFPDLISSFTTKYNAGAKDRTTNLKLAANKINGTVTCQEKLFLLIQ